MIQPHNKILFCGTSSDKAYLPRLKSCVGTATVHLRLEPPITLAELELQAKKLGCSAILTTSSKILQKLLNKGPDEKIASIDNYAGSLFTRNGFEYLIIDPLEHLVTVPYGQFLTKHFITKLIKPDAWLEPINFNWEILNASNADRIFALYSQAALIAIDSETFKNPLSIRCQGYTAIWINSAGKFESHSCVLPLNSEYNLALMRKFNWELQAPKILQNGKYDHAYYARYSAPVYNWLLDTATMFHCWYAELPKDLGFVGAFLVRDSIYWKDLAETSDLHTYYMYNCRDHWTTAIAGIQWLLTAPAWAWNNYVMEFPLNFPSHLCELTGVKRDQQRLVEGRALLDSKIQAKQISLYNMLGSHLNVNSYVQVRAVLHTLLGKKVEESDEAALKKFSYLHPLNARILTAVLDIRQNRKLKSTYMRMEEDANSKNKWNGASEFNGRILYSLIPHGTDSGRNASREHHFWCGLQFQNIPTGKEVKNTVVADEGFVFGEVDLEQAETRDVAYCSGDRNLIAAVNSDKDFHSLNMCAFFGSVYDEIYDSVKKKTKNKTLRDIAKRVNHGANYLMGPDVLLETMGIEEVEKARKLLGLNKLWSPVRVCEHLLEQFHKTYPSLRNTYYPAVTAEVRETKMLVGATGWTRYCFGRPDLNKRDLNRYVAHVTQSLNAMILNKAFWKVFVTIAMNPQHSKNFKLIMQIHDSILFQFRIGHEYLCRMVQECMEIPVTVKGADGVVRTFTVPAAIKAGPDGKGAKYWSDTE